MLLHGVFNPTECFLPNQINAIFVAPDLKTQLPKFLHPSNDKRGICKAIRR
jgi:hypothetical protein